MPLEVPLHGGARLRVIVIEEHVGDWDGARAREHDVVAIDQAAARETLERELDEPFRVRYAAVGELHREAAEPAGRQRGIDLGG